MVPPQQNYANTNLAMKYFKTYWKSMDKFAISDGL